MYYGNYLNAADFLEEYKKSFALGKQTDAFNKMYMKLAKHALYNRSYKDMDLDDAFSGALYDFARYWNHFQLGRNKNEPSAIFGYFTSMARNGAKRQMILLRKDRHLGQQVEIENLEI